MHCYKEFTEQVKSISSHFISDNELSLSETKEDYYVRFSSNEWDVIFLCEYGEIEVSLINLKNGFQYNLSSLFKKLKPESHIIKEFTNNSWSSEKSIMFWVEGLTEFYPFFKSHYKSLEAQVSEHKTRRG